MFFRSLKNEMLTFILALVVLSITLIAALGIISMRTAGSDAEDATTSTIRAQAGNFLMRLTESAANQQDLVFTDIRDESAKLAAYMTNVYGDAVFADNSYWRFDNRVWRDGERYLNSDKDVSTVFIPNFATLDAAERRRMERSAYLDFVAPSVLENHPDVTAVYVIDTAGISRYYPNIVLGNIAPPEHNSLEDEVYLQATPKNDPEKKVVWSRPYDDPAGNGLMISASAPIYTGVGFQGVVGVDVLLANIIDTINTYQPVENSYSFLADKDGYAVALPENGYADILGRMYTDGEARIDLSQAVPDFQTILQGMTEGKTGFGVIKNGERELFIAYAPLRQTDFSLGIVADGETMLKAVGEVHNEISNSVWQTILWRILPISLGLILAATLASIIVVRRIVQPVQELAKGTSEIGAGKFDYRVEVSTKNEIGDLAHSFNQMSVALQKSRQDLESYSHGLEEKVADRTQELAENNARQETLLYFVSHEVKVYLTKSMYAFASIRDGDFGPPPENMKTMAIEALNEMREGMTTVLDILGASSLKRGIINYAKGPFNLRAAIENVVVEHRPIAEKKGLAIEFSATDGDYTFIGDSEKISQHVIRNLVDNAIKYTPKGKVDVELKRMPDRIRFSVRDNGIGITPEDMLKLFTEGGRGRDSLKVNVHSTGYGLFVAKMVVEAHGGKIWAESDGPGTGSVFIIEFPTEVLITSAV